MSKKDKRLIVITIIMIIVLVIGFVWDKNDFVLERTLDTHLSSEMEIKSMKKYGFMFWRKAYQAKILISPLDAQSTLTNLAYTLEVQPEVLSYDEFQKYKEESFEREVLVPEPINGTEVAIIKSVTSNGDYATYMIDIESDTEAYIYIYFARG